MSISNAARRRLAFFVGCLLIGGGALMGWSGMEASVLGGGFDLGKLSVGFILAAIGVAILVWPPVPKE